MITLSLLFACSTPAPESDVVTPVVEAPEDATAVGAVSLVVSSRGDGEIEPCG